MRKVSAILCSSWILGIFIGSFSLQYVWLVGSTIALVLILSLFSLRLQVIIASSFLLLLGITYSTDEAHHSPQLCNAVLPTQATVAEIRGMYATHTLSVFKSEAGCSLLVYAPRTPVLIEGATVRVQGKVEDVADAFKSLSGYVKFLQEEGIGGVVRNPTIVLLSQGTSVVSRIRIGAMNRFAQVFAEPDGGILIAMMIGDRGMIPRDVITTFQRSGITHILSISGFHVSLLAGVLALLLWRMPLPSWLYYCIVLTTLWSYIMVTGLQSAAVRAGLFWTLLMLAYRAWVLIGFPTVLLSTLSILMTVDPTLVRSIGFQLSIAAVTGIGIGIVCLRRFHIPSSIRPLVVSLILSLGATLATIPLTAHYFGNLSLIGILVNILVIPLVAVSMYVALGALALYVVFEPAGLLVSYGVHLCMKAVLMIADAASRIPYGSFQDISFPLWAVGIYYVVCILLVIYMMRVLRIPLREIWV